MNLMTSRFLTLLRRANRNLRKGKDLSLIRSSGLFDEGWYLTNNPDVELTNANPMLHYYDHGGFEGRDPGPNFSSSWYLDNYEDVKKARINPLVHYLKYGRNEGRHPNDKSPYDDNPIKLTITIMAYNHEESIAKALDSVLEQETTYPYLIVIHEDCSTDGTLAICKKYVERYPDKIMLFAQPVNTYFNRDIFHNKIGTFGGFTTKYFCILDGDDAWFDNKKIQIALDFLEKNPSYVIFAHDTIYNDIFNKTQNSLVHEVLGVEINNPVNFENAPYLHPSARIYRNVVKYSEKTIFNDIYFYYLYLDRGPLYYFDKTMSVYNITGKGRWSGLSDSDAKNGWLIAQGILNKYFNYKYDEFFTRRVGKTKTLELFKKLCGKKLAWELWFFIKFIKIDRESALSETQAIPKIIFTSPAWKIALLFRRIRVLLAPPNS